MNRFRIIFLMAVVAMLNAGCSMMAPQYTASIDNVQALKNAGQYTAKVDEFKSSKSKDNANPISIRGSSLSSPYQDSFAAYLAAALRQEVSLAEKISPNGNTEITGTILKNDIDASGFKTGTVTIQARFMVKHNAQPRYDKVLSVHHEFPSSFLGSVAIPRAVQEYPVAVQKLLSSLYADPAFIDALK
jgi:hypothetical protein